MVLFLIGLIVGGILGMALLAVLSSGAHADEQMEHMMKASQSAKFLIDRQGVVIHRN
jgi:uncharacterized membrane-anchored protein YhcB (DUF1043 family)